jgi:hypothetical protein
VSGFGFNDDTGLIFADDFTWEYHLERMPKWRKYYRKALQYKKALDEILLRLRLTVDTRKARIYCLKSIQLFSVLIRIKRVKLRLLSTI